jgi:phenylacetate-coenzyme A ligase PaaK-like adenylate-forming protein
LFNVDEASFASKTLAVFEFQAKNNPVYCDFLHYLDISPSSIKEVSSIPFLPISLFKQHKILVSGVQTDFYFESSGTTQMETSKHFVPDESIYKKSFLNAFKLFYGDIQQYCIAALLPSYLERKNASLVYMCNELIQRSGNSDSGFFLNEWDKLIALIRKNESQGITTILIGVSFALLDLAAQLRMELKHTIIMETGGMKGKRKELTRSELHEILRNSFGVKYINAEYGMTELLSQAYSKQDGIFYTPPWMKILIRDVEDPLSLIGVGKTGCINIIDLANIYSCSFIATQDLGKMHPDGGFEVLGRFDNSDIRGCNLLIE